MSDTLYLQLDQNIQINHPHIYLQDIAKLSCSNSKILKISGYGVAGSRSHAGSHIEGIPEPKVNQSSGGDSCYNCTDIAVTECV